MGVLAGLVVAVGGVPLSLPTGEEEVEREGHEESDDDGSDKDDTVEDDGGSDKDDTVEDDDGPPVIEAALVGPLLLPSPPRPRPLGAAAARAGAASLVPGEGGGGGGEHHRDDGDGDGKDCCCTCPGCTCQTSSSPCRSAARSCGRRRPGRSNPCCQIWKIYVGNLIKVYRVSRRGRTT